MEYRTKPLTRSQIRKLAPIFRSLFGVDNTGTFPVLDALEKIPDIFKGSCYEVVENDELPINTPAKCSIMSDGTFIIKIKQDVYDGAMNNVGAYRNHITHEMCHPFLYSIGYTPIMERSFENGNLPAIESSEWQAKALCGEVMMPFDETEPMCYQMIAEKYGVSTGSAYYRRFKYREDL